MRTPHSMSVPPSIHQHITYIHTNIHIRIASSILHGAVCWLAAGCLCIDIGGQKECRAMWLALRVNVARSDACGDARVDAAV
jgi:hypothetical protein